MQVTENYGHSLFSSKVDENIDQIRKFQAFSNSVKIHVKGEKVSTSNSYLVFYKGAKISINPTNY